MRLEKRKIKALMKNPRYKIVEGVRVPNPMTRAEASVLWSKTRRTRAKYLTKIGEK